MRATVTFKSVMSPDGTWQSRPYLLLDTPTGRVETPLTGMTPRRRKLYDLASQIVGPEPATLETAIARLKACGMQTAQIVELFGCRAMPEATT